MTTKYVLDDAGEPVPCSDLMQWARMFETANRVVARTTVDVADADVSTVFLGLDHQFAEGPPLLFESMVFGGKLDGETRRYTTRAQALEGHAALVEEVRGAGAQDDEWPEDQEPNDQRPEVDR